MSSYSRPGRSRKWSSDPLSAGARVPGRLWEVHLPPPSSPPAQPSAALSCLVDRRLLASSPPRVASALCLPFISWCTADRRRLTASPSGVWRLHEASFLFAWGAVFVFRRQRRGFPIPAAAGATRLFAWWSASTAPIREKMCIFAIFKPLPFSHYPYINQLAVEGPATYAAECSCSQARRESSSARTLSASRVVRTVGRGRRHVPASCT